jgi:hypothetical protein
VKLLVRRLREALIVTHKGAVNKAGAQPMSGARQSACMSNLPEDEFT